jgi:saccharopine dehydrogenase (NAD+, L-lysine-forming)
LGTKKVVVLGGGGVVGRTAVKDLARSGVFSEVVVADREVEGVERELSGLPGVSFVKLDVTDREALRRVMEGAEVVLNTVGPFYKFGPLLTREAIRAGVNYVDICDDYEATLEQLKMDEEARRRGVTVLTGMGSSPGVANVVAKFCSDLLDTTEEVHVYHVHGGEPAEGPGVIYHRIHYMTGDIPMLKDGRMVYFKFFSREGEEEIEEVDFYEPIGVVKVYPYPHPETITLPRYLPGLRRVTNKGTVLPEEYYELLRQAVRMGLASEEPIRVGGASVAPIDFLVSFVLSRRREYASRLPEPVGCLKIVVRGRKEGRRMEYRFATPSRGAGMGEGTAIPASVATQMVAKGEIDRKGVFPPEACVDPMSFFQAVRSREGMGGVRIIFESVDEQGRVSRIPL